MNKLIALVFPLITLVHPLLFAEEESHIEARLSAFIPSDKLMREIYGSCLINYEIEASRLIAPNYEVWGNLSYLSKDGETAALHTKTQISQANLSIGLKRLFQLDPSVQLYLGAGANGAFNHLYNDSDYVERNDYKAGIGAIIKAGAYFRPIERLVFEVFTDYLYQRLSFETKTQVGGVRIGASMGFDL